MSPATTASTGCRRATTPSSSSSRASRRFSSDADSHQRGLRRDHQREARGRQPGGDHHGHRPVARGRRPVERAADRHEPGDSRGRADRARPVVAGQADSRRAGGHLRRGRHPVGAAEQHVGPRLQHQRRQLQHRRRHGELAGRRRRRDDDVLRPGDVRRGQLHDLGDSRRNARRRRLHQHGDQGRRQPVAGQRPLLVRQRRPAVRELGRHAGHQSRVPRQPDQEDLRLQPVGRRRARCRTGCG